MEVTIRDEPYLTSADYRTKYSEPCVKVKQYGQTWYFGTGIAPEEHPLKGHIGIRGCGNCQSENVKVIAAQRSVSYASGDQYWDCEVYCEDCGKYTQRAYAEN